VGELVVAFVVTVGLATDAIDPQVLDKFCLDHLARFKRPKRYVVVPSLPKNNYGKVLKRELRQLLTVPGDSTGGPLLEAS
jgi:long-chain acyl-CoA synthetase